MISPDMTNGDKLVVVYKCKRTPTLAKNCVGKDKLPMLVAAWAAWVVACS